MLSLLLFVSYRISKISSWIFSNPSTAVRRIQSVSFCFKIRTWSAAEFSATGQQMPDGFNLWAFVLRFGHAGVVRELCGKGADPTAVNKEGTPDLPRKKELLQPKCEGSSCKVRLISSFDPSDIWAKGILYYFYVHNFSRNAQKIVKIEKIL